ncbi:MAG: class I SAM-dependent methyltransferase [Candidatus Thorarchaeota archaeon]
MARSHTNDWKDPERIPRMIDSYEARYGPDFWSQFMDLVGTESRAVVADFGCGPGVFLKDAAERFEAHEIHGYDASKYMLEAAAKILGEAISKGKILLHRTNFDNEPFDIDPDSIDLGFSGYMLHEVADPSKFVDQIAVTIRGGGRYAILDFVSGDKEAFVRTMTSRGMTEEKARRRYPHMCKHSVDDIERILLAAGFSSVEHRMLDEARVIAVGLRE